MMAAPRVRGEHEPLLRQEPVIVEKGPGLRNPGRSHADRGLKFGDCKGVFFAPGRNLNAFYEAFMTTFIAFA
jgi:hypothetical protein